jgi:hypothetical protein
MLNFDQNLTLEELDNVFNVGNREHAKYYTQKMPWYFQKHVLRRDVEPFEPLYQFSDETPYMRDESKAVDAEKGEVVR